MMNRIKSMFTAVTPSGEEQREVAEGDHKLLENLHAWHEENYGFRSGTSEGGASFEAQWDQNLRRFLGDQGNHITTAQSGLQEGYKVFHFVNDGGSLMGFKRASINRTQTNTIANVAGMTQQPFYVSITPQETADKPVYILTPQGGQAIAGLLTNAPDVIASEQANMDLAQAQNVEYMPAVDIGLLSQMVGLGLTEEQVNGDPEHGPIAPLTNEQGQFIADLIANGMFPQDAMVVITDQVAADCAQALFDNCWERAQGDMIVVMNEYLCNIVGHCPLRFQWMPDKDGFILENTHVLNVAVDPHHDHMDACETLEFDHLLSMDRAIAEMPQFEKDFESAKQSGELKSSMRMQHSYRTANFKREMVIVRTTWARYQPIPMSLEEALASGKVQERRDPVMMLLEDGTESPALDETGEPMLSEEISGYVNESGEETEEGADNWPTKRGLLQVVWLPQIDKVVDVQECPYLDIPFAWNVNIPIPYCMYGQGEPQRLEDLQQQINRLLTIIIGYCQYYQFPQRYWRQSTLENIKKHGIQIHARPGAEIPIPDQDYDRMMAQAGGRPCIVQDIPAMPAMFMDLLDRLLAEIDNLSGNVDIRQGKVPSGVESGKAIEQLRTESYGPLAFKSKFTEWMVERIAKLAVDAIQKWMTEATKAEILDQYSLPALRLINERMAYLKWNIRCEISTGRGSNQERAEQRAMNLRQMELISKRKTLEMLRLDDPDAILKEMREEQAAEAMSSVPVQAAATDNQQT